MAAVLVALGSGMFSHLAGWAAQVAWIPANLLVRWQASGLSWGGVVVHAGCAMPMISPEELGSRAPSLPEGRL